MRHIKTIALFEEDITLQNIRTPDTIALTTPNVDFTKKRSKKKKSKRYIK